MLWKIICFNGTTWKATFSMPLADAVESFKGQTGLTELDIKDIHNLT